MSTLKKHGRNRAKIEGSICEGHIQVEAMSLCKSIVRQLGSTCQDLWVGEEQEKEEKEGEVLLGATAKKRLNATELFQVTSFVLTNIEDMEEWMAFYEEEKESTPARDRDRFPKIKEYMRSKIDALDSGMVALVEHPTITDRIRSLVDGPETQVSSRTHMWAGGRHFRVYDLDKKKKRTQDSGVFGHFTQDSRASRHDVNVVRDEVPYFGRIRYIWELEYRGFFEVVLYCDWHQTNLRGDRATLVRDNGNGLWRIQTSHIMRCDRAQDEPLAYPSSVTQCAYVPSAEHEGWSFAIPYAPTCASYL